MLNNFNSISFSNGSSNICIIKLTKLRLNTWYVDDGGPYFWINSVCCQSQVISRFTFFKLANICICNGILNILFFNFLDIKLSTLRLIIRIFLRIILLQSLYISIYVYNLFYVSNSKIFGLLAFKWKTGKNITNDRNELSNIKIKGRIKNEIENN